MGMKESGVGGTGEFKLVDGKGVDAGVGWERAVRVGLVEWDKSSRLDVGGGKGRIDTAAWEGAGQIIKYNQPMPEHG